MMNCKLKKKKTIKLIELSLVKNYRKLLFFFLYLLKGSSYRKLLITENDAFCDYTEIHGGCMCTLCVWICMVIATQLAWNRCNMK